MERRPTLNDLVETNLLTQTDSSLDLAWRDARQHLDADQVLLMTSPSYPGWEVEGTSEQVSMDEAWSNLVLDTRCRQVVLAPLVDRLPMVVLRRALHRAIRLLSPGGTIVMLARNPDLRLGDWPAQERVIDGVREFYRPWRHYVELFRLFGCRMRTPLPMGGNEQGAKFSLLRAITPAKQDDLEAEQPQTQPSTKYGTDYRRFNRLEEPEILDDCLYGISRLMPRAGDVVLSLGINDGREFELFSSFDPDGLIFHGVDHSEEAILQARARFPKENYQFHLSDVMSLDELDLPKVDLVVAFNVLQCRDLDRDRLLGLLKDRLGANPRLLISLPNCHFSSEDISRRPLDRKDPRHDRSIIHRDMRALARRFYRWGFTDIESFGTYDAFLSIR